MFESRISAEATQKIVGWEKPQAKTVALFYERRMMHRDCSQVQSQSVQMHGYVSHDTSGYNLGRTLKMKCFFLKESCTDTHMQDC